MRENDRVAVAPLPSDTATVTVVLVAEEPTAPEMIPVALASDSPDGRDPVEMLHVRLPDPPDAARVCE